ncbi:hypothetical protein BDV25DRAFT_170668 [Aspergillus avenaceus]|uniref:Amine oxidase domain-containing protein n=1 Tax=Aspergillus avenaceus TaxID=36643 RepID=A0A5N6U102_ASPAV|nr:hypothetical protein BDV25DRAFT_170668 [Aspergillus avenaceus]
MKPTLLQSCTTFLISAAAAYPSVACEASRVVTKDVTVIGGGASGAYAAIQLLDNEKSVALIEQKPILGGHTNTYTDPSTNQTIDYGVHQWNDMPVVTEFFDRLAVPYTKAYVPSPGEIVDFDFHHGGPSNRSLPNATVSVYADVVEKYDFLQYGTELPHPVPEDIYRPFGDFVQKYGLEGYVPSLWNGQGDILHMPALYIMKDVGPAVLKSMKTNFIYTKNQNNYEIFQNAGSILRQDSLFLSSAVSELKRDDSGVSICLDTPQGRTLLHSSKVLITIPPLLDNMKGFDLTQEERAVFAQFTAVGYYVALVSIPDLPVTTFMYRNIAPDTLYGQPTLPALYRLTRIETSDLFIAEYGSLHPLSEEAVRVSIFHSIHKLRRAEGALSHREASILAYDSHTPYHLHVPGDAIRDGFYTSLYALQGQRNTFYSGAAFHAHDSALLWRFTGNIVRVLVGDLH